MEHLIALIPLLSSLPAFQAFAGFIALILSVWLILKANKDKVTVPAPAPGGIGDVPAPFLHGPREVVDMMREKRDYLRRLVEDSGHIRECARITREEAVKQTVLLDRMAEDIRVEHRVAAERHAAEQRGHP